MNNRLKFPLASFGLLVGVAILAGFFSPADFLRQKPTWTGTLEQEIKEIDLGTNGNLGVYIKKRGTQEEMNYQTDRPWYFASTVKVPVAIAVLQKVEEGAFDLNHQVVLKKSDFVDGSGEVRFQRPGSRLSVSYLLEKMLTQSDSTATDLLIRLVGEDDLNRRIREKMGVEGFHPFTTILDVRHDAFAYLHPNAKNLTNENFLALKNHKSSSAKIKYLAKQMRVPPSALREKSVEAAFEKYYETRLNSGSLKSFGLLLEKLADGELLSKPHTALVLGHMQKMTTGDRRIKAGLPKGVIFAQKTGTQVSRICNVGIAFAPGHESQDVIVTACVEKFSDFNDAERTLQKVGRALARLFKSKSIERS